MQAERGVQPPAVHSDEGLDGAEGIAAGDDGKNGEQQNIGQLVEHTFGAAWVRDLAEHGEEWIERLHGYLPAVWLPGIDSDILPRRNPTFPAHRTIRLTVAP